MQDQEHGSEGVDREDWLDRINRNDLRSAKPQAIVAACRRLNPERDVLLRGRLLDHLVKLATDHLATRVDRQLPNEGRDAIGEVVGNMVASIIDPDAADGRGFEHSFINKLEHRLIDHVRRWRRETVVIEPQLSDEVTGHALETPDGYGLSPEDEAMAQDIVAGLPDNYRKAFLLRRAGFAYDAASRSESIAAMLDVTPKTAKAWVEKAHALIHHQLGIGR